jgi:hypothetical protein
MEGAMGKGTPALSWFDKLTTRAQQAALRPLADAGVVALHVAKSPTSSKIPHLIQISHLMVGLSNQALHLLAFPAARLGKIA